MGYGFSMAACVFVIVICLIALIVNVIAGYFFWSLVMIVCIVFNLIALLRLYSVGRYF